MNSLFIVLPILTILMFDLGLTLEGKDFRLVMLRYKAVLAGMIGQLFLLPLIAWGVAGALSLSPLFTIGLMLIACCPGGSSSNVFSMLAEAMGVKLPVVNLLMQNVVTMLLPILLGIGVRHYWRETARKIERVLSRLAFPALMLLAGIFFVQHKTTIADNFGTLGLATTLLLLCATTGAGLLCYVFRLRTQERRTIVIEVGMQNAAQAIAVASSPFVFNDGRMAIPGIIYALMMNVILLTYVGIINRGKILG